ncbi:MAG: HAD-IB family hydrolase [Proteobacteria bacterium]|nr:HAD-IB family hydrolase [Pseudomonadota bacterium]
MTAVDTMVAAIEAGARGPAVGAFFDFDGTLIDGYSAAAYFGDRFRRREMTLTEAMDVAHLALHPDMDEAGFAAAIGRSLAPWSGHSEQEIIDLWLRLFRSKIGTRLFPEAWKLVKAHQRMGHTVAIASSAMRYQVVPFAEELGIGHLLCTRVAVRDGRLTGAIEGPTLWGNGKAEAVRAFAQDHDVDLSRSHGYANGNEDIAFLRVVRQAVAVNPKRMLAATARQEGWKVLRFGRRRKASNLAVARSVAAYGALAATSLGGVAYAVATGKKRRAAELVSAVGSDAMLAVSGIRVDLQGEEHLWAHRPSVFLFNHQSNVDAYVLLKLLRRGIVAVAKKEAAHFPLLGQIMRALDFAFIDRANTRDAIEALRPAVDRLRAGLSVVIAPEGTRSFTPRLGRFKKGGFHIAMQAGAPIVPVVLRNTYEVMPRDSLLFRPGTVQVCALPPIDVTAWRGEDLDDHVADVRSLFQRTLDDWPRSRTDPAHD